MGLFNENKITKSAVLGLCLIFAAAVVYENSVRLDEDERQSQLDEVLEQIDKVPLIESAPIDSLVAFHQPDSQCGVSYSTSESPQVVFRSSYGEFDYVVVQNLPVDCDRVDEALRAVFYDLGTDLHGAFYNTVGSGPIKEQSFQARQKTKDDLVDDIRKLGKKTYSIQFVNPSV